MSDSYQFPIFATKSTPFRFNLGSKYDVPKYRWLKWLLGKMGLLKQSEYTYMVDTLKRDLIKQCLDETKGCEMQKCMNYQQKEWVMSACKTLDVYNPAQVISILDGGSDTLDEAKCFRDCEADESGL